MSMPGKTDADDRVCNDLGEEYYDENYGDYDRQSSARKLRFYLSLVRKWVPDDASLFELGVGKGNFLQVAANHYKVTGCDINSYGVQTTASKVPTATLMLGSTECLPRQSTYDAVVALDVLEHLTDLDDGLSRIATSLRPGGSLIAVVPVYDGPLGWLVRALDKDETHVSKEGRDWWLKKLADHGFGVVEYGGVLRKLVANRYYLHLTSPQLLLRFAGVALYLVARSANR